MPFLAMGCVSHPWRSVPLLAPPQLVDSPRQFRLALKLANEASNAGL